MQDRHLCWPPTFSIPESALLVERMTGAFKWPSLLRRLYKCLPNLSTREQLLQDMFGAGWVGIRIFKAQ